MCLLFVGVVHPGGLVEHDVFQLLVLCQSAGQRGGGLLSFPLFKHGLDLWRLLHDVCTKAVGVVCRGETDGVVVLHLADIGQCLNHEPGRVVGVFDGELLVSAVSGKELVQLERGCALLVQGEGQRVGHQFFIREHRQVMLLAVAETVACGGNPADEQRMGVVGRKTEIYGCRTVGIQGEGCFLFSHHTFGVGVNQLQTGRAFERFVGGVEHT